MTPRCRHCGVGIAGIPAAHRGGPCPSCGKHNPTWKMCPDSRAALRCVHDWPYEGENACPVCSKAYRAGFEEAQRLRDEAESFQGENDE